MFPKSCFFDTSLAQFCSRRGLRTFIFSTASRTILGPTQPPIQWVPGALSLGVKQQGREADHSPTSNAQYAFASFKSTGITLPLPYPPCSGKYAFKASSDKISNWSIKVQFKSAHVSQKRHFRHVIGTLCNTNPLLRSQSRCMQCYFSIECRKCFK
jgi:hypothetical protein